jgi:hypothetical protein
MQADHRVFSSADVQVIDYHLLQPSKSAENVDIIGTMSICKVLNVPDMYQLRG